MSEELDERRAIALVQKLTEERDTRCADCGELIDVSDAETELDVVARLEDHRNDCAGEWYE